MIYSPLTPERVRELTKQYRPEAQVAQKPEPRALPSQYSYVTTAERERMVQLWNEGKHLCDISREVGREQSVVRINLRKSGIDTKLRAPKISARRNIIAELKAGGSVVEIARRRHKPPSYVLRLAHEAGLHASEIDTGKECAA